MNEDEEEMKSGQDGSCHVDVCWREREDRKEEEEEEEKEGGCKREERHSRNVTFLDVMLSWVT